MSQLMFETFAAAANLLRMHAQEAAASVSESVHKGAATAKVDAATRISLRVGVLA